MMMMMKAGSDISYIIALLYWKA